MVAMDFTSAGGPVNHQQRPTSLSFDVEPKRPITECAVASITDHDTSSVTVDPTAAYDYVTSGLSPGMKLAGNERVENGGMKEKVELERLEYLRVFMPFFFRHFFLLSEQNGCNLHLSS